MFARKSWRRTARSALCIARTTRKVSNEEIATAIRSLRASRRNPADAIEVMLGYVIRAYMRASRRVPRVTEVIAAVAILDRGALFLQSPAGRAVGATLAAGVAAALGRRVHVLTQDEARAIAVTETAQATLALLNIGFGFLQAGQSLPARQQHHRQPIVFAAINQLARDYLRDVAIRNPAKSQLRQNIESLGAAGSIPSPAAVCDVAIIDAIDALLCESGSVSVFGPSASDEPASCLILQVTGLIGELDAGADFIESAERVRLSSRGQIRLGLIGRALGPPWADLSSQRQIRLAERALTARAISPDQYRIVDRQVEPITAAVRSLLDEPADEDPGVARFLAAHEGIDHRGTISARRISLHRFASKYKRFGGTMAQSDIACGELRRRYGLSATPDLRRRRIRVLLASNEVEARSLFLSEVRAANGHRMPVLIVAANQNVAVRTTQLLKEAGIGSACLSGAPMPEDAALVVDALSACEGPVIIGPGRNLPSTLGSALGNRMRLMLVGLEVMTIPPDRLILDFPSAALEDEPTAVLDIGCELVQEHSSAVERFLLNLLVARTGAHSQTAIRLLLRLALHRSARRQESKRARAFKHEEQHLISLAFAGPVSRRY
jgi:SecA DEAD-like domain